jgi:hypothetical protein
LKNDRYIMKESHNNDFIFKLTMRQLSLAVAALLAFSFFIFIAGYFLGQKRAVEEFSHKLDQDSLADQIYSSMCVLYDVKDENEDGVENDMNEEAEEKEELPQESGAESVVAQNKYKVTIAGFSAANSAAGKKLVAQLKNKGYEAELVEIISKSAKGKSVTWYQAIVICTSSPENMDTIKHSIAKIAHVNQKDISINECV